MAVPRCPDSFEDHVSRFIADLGPQTFLPLSAVQVGQQQVIDAIAADVPVVVRNFGRYQNAAAPYRSRDGRRRFVVGDNEPVVWFWRQLLQGGPIHLPEAIRSQTLPISIIPDKGEDERNWATWGNGDAKRVRERWRGLPGGRWKLCHAFQAAPAHLDESDAGLVARFVRNFHPINHFWFASDYSWRAGRFVMTPAASLCEWRPLCMAVFRAYRSRYPAEASWFMKAANLSDSEMRAAEVDEDPVVGFRWQPKATAPRLANAIGRLHIDASNGDERVCLIRETRAGRFHLSHFGQAIGGQNRDVPFRFRVVAAEGEVLAESNVVTAQELGIAEKGVGDYQADRYRQTDFMMWEAGEGLAPHQAVAQRVPGWTFY